MPIVVCLIYVKQCLFTVNSSDAWFYEASFRTGNWRPKEPTSFLKKLCNFSITQAGGESFPLNQVRFYKNFNLVMNLNYSCAMELCLVNILANMRSLYLKNFTYLTAILWTQLE